MRPAITLARRLCAVILALLSVGGLGGMNDRNAAANSARITPAVRTARAQPMAGPRCVNRFPQKPLCKFVDDLAALPLTFVDASAGETIKLGAYDKFHCDRPAPRCTRTAPPATHRVLFPSQFFPISLFPSARPPHTPSEQKFHRDLPDTKVYAFGASRSSARYPGLVLLATCGTTTKVSGTLPGDKTHMFTIDPTLMAPKLKHGGVPISKSTAHLVAFDFSCAVYSPCKWFSAVNQSVKIVGLSVHCVSNVRSLFPSNSLLNSIFARFDSPPLFALFDSPPLFAHFDVTAAVHKHGGETPSTSDGHPLAWYTASVLPFYLVSNASPPFPPLLPRCPMSLSPHPTIGSDGGYLVRPLCRSSLLVVPGTRHDLLLDFNAAPASCRDIILVNSAAIPFHVGQPADWFTGVVMRFIINQRSPIKPPAVPNKLSVSFLPVWTSPPVDLAQAARHRWRALVFVIDRASREPSTMLLDGKASSAPATKKAQVVSTEHLRRPKCAHEGADSSRAHGGASTRHGQQQARAAQARAAQARAAQARAATGTGSTGTGSTGTGSTGTGSTGTGSNRHGQHGHGQHRHRQQQAQAAQARATQARAAQARAAQARSSNRHGQHGHGQHRHGQHRHGQHRHGQQQARAAQARAATGTGSTGTGSTRHGQQQAQAAQARAAQARAAQARAAEARAATGTGSTGTGSTGTGSTGTGSNRHGQHRHGQQQARAAQARAAQARAAQARAAQARAAQARAATGTGSTGTGSTGTGSTGTGSNRHGQHRHGQHRHGQHRHGQQQARAAQARAATGTGSTGTGSTGTGSTGTGSTGTGSTGTGSNRHGQQQAQAAQARAAQARAAQARAAQGGTSELWHIINPTFETHPIHLHLIQHRPISRRPIDSGGLINASCSLAPSSPVKPSCFTGPARAVPEHERGWKDTTVAFPNSVLTIFVLFKGQVSEMQCSVVEGKVLG
ncbi:unnamed protein product [Closterium sp. NIES-64]|nr:unnamed protein product [Closterium sp. NIES-64]